MIDRLAIRIGGAVGERATPEGAGELFERYRSMMLERAGHVSAWSAPSVSQRHKCETVFTPNASTISFASLKAEWAYDRVLLSLRMDLNPTRTLVHLLPEAVQSADAAAMLRAMDPTHFFATSADAAPAPTLDGNDNALAGLRAVFDALGDDAISNFIVIYDQQIRQWATEAVAPVVFGFRSREERRGIYSSNDETEVLLQWPLLTILKAEAYVERRHTGAVALMDRLSRRIPAGHSGAQWRRYDMTELGGRTEGSEIVGLDLTKSVQQVYYAKTRNRVRAETRYNKSVRNSVRKTVSGAEMVALADLVTAIRLDAVTRTQWEGFWAMCAEPGRATLHEFARLVSQIATVAQSVRTDPLPVLTSLLATGGIDETGREGDAPPKLIRKLHDAGVIEGSGLQRRRRPGVTRRHRLRAGWFEAAEQLQEAFAVDVETDRSA